MSNSVVPRLMETSLMTPLGVVSGEALAYIEQHRQTTLRQLIRALPWPTALVTMGVGALVREGLVQALQREFDIVLQPHAELAAPS